VKRHRVLLGLFASVIALPAFAQPAQPAAGAPSMTIVDGGIRRGPLERKRIALVFTGHEFGEGAATILDALAARGARASFFLTGTFLRDPALQPFVRRMVAGGHYVGPHSDAHLLYAPWEGPTRTLVSREAFREDLQRNVEAVTSFGVPREAVTFFLPSYEWYTAEIAAWTREMGMTLVCHTQGTRSTADYTGEGTPQFVSSDAIFASILRREREDPHGLNGFLLLLHVGAGPGRADKFHPRFGALLDELSSRGYTFVRVDTLLEGVTAGGAER
jgi:peptidoglycan/xylan/chitin deacetylase (PgdA/CDA1 family)